LNIRFCKKEYNNEIVLSPKHIAYLEIDGTFHLIVVCFIESDNNMLNFKSIEEFLSSELSIIA